MHEEECLRHMSNDVVRDLLMQIKANEPKKPIYKIEVGNNYVEFGGDIMWCHSLVTRRILIYEAITPEQDYEDTSPHTITNLMETVSLQGDTYFYISNGRPVVVSGPSASQDVEILDVESFVHAMYHMDLSYNINDVLNIYLPKLEAEINELIDRRDSLQHYISEGLIELSRDRIREYLESRYSWLRGDSERYGGVEDYTLYYDYKEGRLDLTQDDLLPMYLVGLKTTIGLSLDLCNDLTSSKLDHIMGVIRYEVDRMLYLLNREINYLESQINN